MTDGNSLSPRPSFGFRPRLWPTLIALPMIVVMLGLGAWQLQRLAWKESLIERLETRMYAEPIAPPANDIDIEDAEFRRVRAEGRFLNEQEMFLVGRPEKGTVGLHVVTPFVTADGRTLLVNRGWIPDDRREAAKRPNSQPEGIVTLDGIVRRPSMRNAFTPDNEPEKNLWFYVDIAEMSQKAGVTGVPPYYIDALREGDNRIHLPIGADPRIGLRNEHLQYAMTWFLMALGLIVVYVVWHRRADRGEV